jgi:hypothetical protein
MPRHSLKYPAHQDVVARAAEQEVLGSVADDQVVAGAARRALDVCADVVALAGLTVVRDAVERDRDGGRARVIEHLVARVAAA